MVDVEAVILDELGRLSPLGGFERANWSDVVARAHPPEVAGGSAITRARVPATRRRRIYLVLAVLALLIAVATPALAFRSEIIDFFTASHAPKDVVVYFNRLEAFESAPPGVAPGVLPAQARRITSVRIGDSTSVLYVAPTKRGGFCALWTSSYAPTCLAEKAQTGSSRYALTRWSAIDPALGVDTIQGEVFVRDATATLLYGDGAATVIPYLWVTAPIRTGFFLYSVPDGRRLGKTRPVALTITVGGKTVFRQAISDFSNMSLMVDHRDRWGQSIQTSREAVWSKRRLLFSFMLPDGQLIEQWVMPSRAGTGRRCFAGTTSSGCEPAVLTGPPVQLRLFGGGRGDASVLLTGEVARTVGSVQLRFQDGSRVTIKPKEGFVLAKLAPTHYGLGRRLVSAVGLDESLNPVGSAAFQPAQPDVYPCTKPKNYGYGVTRCP
jgi:hypothetical protein